MRLADLTPWEELPNKCGEDGKEWNNNMARYGHQGCPGIQYEDVCAEPWECAVKGKCRVSHEKWLEIMRKEQKEKIA